MGLGSGIRKKPIPDPGSGYRGQKGPGSPTLPLCKSLFVSLSVYFGVFFHLRYVALSFVLYI
jgi:hypothetical protein